VPTTASTAIDELASALPTVAGYVYADVYQNSVWMLTNPQTKERVSLDEYVATAVTRPVFAQGGDPAIGLGWIGEITVFDAGTLTPLRWIDFAESHRVQLAVGPRVA